MKHELSILIPVYNTVCVPLVTAIRQQAVSAGITFEIIVGDDGSTEHQTVEANQSIDAMEHCRYICRQPNAGRAAIRNFLAREARYPWLLFIDSHMTVCSQQFLQHYLETDGNVIYGGYIVGEGETSSLRYCYEKACEAQHRASVRQQRPYQHFHTCNFVVSRDVMLAHPFDERFRRYGYEDVLFGKQLKQGGISITHIENPVGFLTFEPNDQFLRKTEEALDTLNDFRDDLRGYSQMLTLTEGIHIGLVKSLIRLWHRLFGTIERRNLCGRHPNLTVFKLYKIGYYLTIKN